MLKVVFADLFAFIYNDSNRWEMNGMADQEQLDILKQGVDTWNTWRQENTHKPVDFSRMNFKEALLTADFRNFRRVLSKEIISGIIHGQHRRIRRTYNRVNLSKVDFSMADLRKVLLDEAILTEANLSGADLSGSDLSGADLSGVNLNKADLSNATLNWANLSRADLSEANLSRTSLVITKLLTFRLTTLTRTSQEVP